MDRKILIIGLDSAPVRDRLRPSRRVPDPGPPDRGRSSRQDAELRPADHHPGLDGHDHGQGRRPAGPLRVPPPHRLLLRQDVDRHGPVLQGEGGLGLSSATTAARASSSASRRATLRARSRATSSAASSPRRDQGLHLSGRSSRTRSRPSSAPTCSTSSSGPRTATRSSGRSTP